MRYISVECEQCKTKYNLPPLASLSHCNVCGWDTNSSFTGGKHPNTASGKTGFRISKLKLQGVRQLT